MSELASVWIEVASNNRFAETKLAFFIGLVIAIIGVVDSTAATNLLVPISFLRGGDREIMNIGAIGSLLLSFLGIFPRLVPRRRRVRLVPRLIRRQPNLYFFIDIASFRTSEAWLAATGIAFADDDKKRASMLATQIYTIAIIATRKFFLLRWALVFLAGSWIFSWPMIHNPVVALLRHWLPFGALANLH
jgi:pycsar effector protein